MLAQPVFIVGSERSGTTLLRLMLNQHPQVGMHCEFEFAVDQLPDNHWPQIETYLSYLTQNRVFNLGAFNLNASLPYPQLVDDLLRQKTDPHNNHVVGATIHTHFDQITRIWPDARFIHLVRDGRDVTHSVYRKGWGGNHYSAAQRWIEAEQTWSRLAATLTPDQHTTVYYEQLIRNPQETLQGLCDFMGVSFDTTLLDYNQNSRYDPVSVNFIDQWRRKLTAQQVRLIEARITPILQQHNYALSNSHRLHIGPLRHKILLSHSRISKLLRRAKQFGPILTFSEMLARKLHLKTLQRKLQLQLNHRENQNLGPNPVPKTDTNAKPLKQAA